MLLRTVLSGHTIVYEPRAVVHHAHRPDYADLRRQVYSYGVGLTAYYLKTLLARPALIGDFLAKLPVGLRFMLSADSGLNDASSRTIRPSSSGSSDVGCWRAAGLRAEPAALRPPSGAVDLAEAPRRRVAPPR